MKPLKSVNLFPVFSEIQTAQQPSNYEMNGSFVRTI